MNIQQGQIPSKWVGENVRLDLVAGEFYSIIAHIQDVNNSGVVALVMIDVPVYEGRTSPLSQPVMEKIVPKFFPWHAVHAIRVLEPEEEPLPNFR